MVAQHASNFHHTNDNRLKLRTLLSTVIVDNLLDLDGIFATTALLPDAARSAVTSAVDPTHTATVLRHH